MWNDFFIKIHTGYQWPLLPFLNVNNLFFFFLKNLSYELEEGNIWSEC